MRYPLTDRLVTRSLAVALAAGSWTVTGFAAQDDKTKDVKKASLSLKASPTIVFSPARVVVSAELKGGAEDNGELYCPEPRMGLGRRHALGIQRGLRAV